MNVTSITLKPCTKEGSTLKAFGKAIIDNKISLDILVMDKGDGTGPWVTFPGGRKNEKTGKWYTPVFFVEEETRIAFNSRVIDEYSKSANSQAPAINPDSLPF